MNEVNKLKRGAQPGNRNARKHGFYTAVLDETEKHALKQAARVKGLDQEIDILRIKLLSVIQNDPQNVRLISQAAVSLSRLLYTRDHLTGKDEQSLGNAIRDIIREVGIPLGLNPDPDLLAKSEPKK
jgi:hypothetical protein